MQPSLGHLCISRWASPSMDRLRRPLAMGAPRSAIAASHLTPAHDTRASPDSPAPLLATYGLDPSRRACGPERTRRIDSSTRRSISGVLPDVLGSLHGFDPEPFAASFLFDLRRDMRLCTVIMQTPSSPSESLRRRRQARGGCHTTMPGHLRPSSHRQGADPVAWGDTRESSIAVAQDHPSRSDRARRLPPCIRGALPCGSTQGAWPRSRG